MSIAKCGYKDLEKYRKARNACRKRYYDKTAKYEKRNWDPMEDLLVITHSVPDSVLSGQICRSVHSIQDRRCRLNKQNLEDKSNMN